MVPGTERLGLRLTGAAHRGPLREAALFTYCSVHRPVEDASPSRQGRCCYQGCNPGARQGFYVRRILIRSLNHHHDPSELIQALEACGIHATLIRRHLATMPDICTKTFSGRILRSLFDDIRFYLLYGSLWADKRLKGMDLECLLHSLFPIFVYISSMVTLGRMNDWTGILSALLHIFDAGCAREMAHQANCGTGTQRARRTTLASDSTTHRKVALGGIFGKEWYTSSHTGGSILSGHHHRYEWAPRKEPSLPDHWPHARGLQS
jgi:hypothetical protein